MHLLESLKPHKEVNWIFDWEDYDIGLQKF